MHPSVLRMALCADPDRCILITDSVELAGLPDGIYPGNGQIAQRQRKVGSRVTLVRDDQETETEGLSKAEQEKEEVLVGSCSNLHDCVRNMVAMTGCGIAEAVRCVSENVAGLMGESMRGVLEPGRRADFVLLDADAYRIRETWMQGLKVFGNVAGNGNGEGREGE